jgi:multiple sugar transport system substrate-binding protein
MALRTGKGRIRTLAGLVAAGAILAAIVPGATAAQDKTRIVWSTWGNPDELTRFDEFNTDFMARHPDIEVVLQPVPSYSDYHSKLLAQLISGTAPDLFYVGDDNIGKFVDSNVLQPVDDLMAAPDSRIKPADFLDGLYGAAQKDGVTYGIPVDDNPDVLWYDKQALAAAGITEDPAELAANGEWTVAKFLEMNDKLKAAGLLGAIYWNYWATHWSWVSANGGTVFDDQGNFVLPGDPASIAALETLAARFGDGSFALADTMPEGAGADTTFLTHGAGFFSQGRYTIGTIMEGGEQDSYDIVRWPTVDGQPRPTGVAAAYMGINKASPNVDAAWQFYQDFLSADGQRFRLSGGGNAVPSVKGADDVVLEGYPVHAQTFLDVRDQGFVDFAAEARVPGLSSDISAAMQKLYEGKATVDETVKTMTDLVAAGSQP